MITKKKKIFLKIPLRIEYEGYEKNPSFREFRDAVGDVGFQETYSTSDIYFIYGRGATLYELRKAYKRFKRG